MTKQEIEQTNWAMRFKAECPTSYQEAVSLAEKVEWVYIDKRDDHSFKGDYLWSIIPELNSEFWLDALATKKEALNVCREMGWRIRRQPLC